MAKFVPDTTLDAMLDVIADNVDRIDICSTQPTNYTEATSTYSLGNTTVTAGTAGADWSIANGDTSGRKLTLAEQTGVSIGSNGDAQHIAGTNGTDTLYFVTTCTLQTVTSGNTATIQTFDIEIQDAA